MVSSVEDISFTPTMSYNSVNAVKSSFEHVYDASTPHAYFAEMQRLGYEIGEQAKPFFQAASEHLRRRLSPGQAVRLLDLGCSYGVGAALLKYDFSFKQLADCFSGKPATDRRVCVEETRELFAAADEEVSLECVGLDASA